LQASFGGGSEDAFVTELNPMGTALIYSTYLGGSGNDTGVGIALDSNKNAYVTGQTASTNFPTASPTQSANGGQNDAFVTEIGAGGSALVFSTYLGGSLNENTSATNGGGAVGAIAVDTAGANIYVTGNTVSTNFPVTVGAEQPTNAGLTDAFVARYSLAAAGPSFTIADGALSATSGNPGVSPTATITVTSVNSFNSQVTLSCAVTPVVTKGPTCSFSNPGPMVTPPANSTVTATLNVATVTASALLNRPSEQRPSGVFYAVLLPMVGITLLGAGIGSGGSRRKKLFGFLTLGMLLIGLLLVPACGGSYSNPGGGSTGTPAGTYNITVTGNGGGVAATGSPALTLTVN
jgi:hypothetical protein